MPINVINEFYDNSYRKQHNDEKLLTYHGDQLVNVLKKN